MSSEGSRSAWRRSSSEEFRRACGRFRHRCDNCQRAGRRRRAARPDRELFHVGFARPAADPHLPGPRGHRRSNSSAHRRYFGINVLARRPARALRALRAQGRTTASTAWSGTRRRPACRCSPACWPPSNAPSTSASPRATTISSSREMVRASVAEGEPLIHFVQPLPRPGPIACHVKLEDDEQPSLVSSRSARTVARAKAPTSACASCESASAAESRFDGKAGHQPRLQQLPGPDHPSQTARSGAARPSQNSASAPAPSAPSPAP